MIEDDPGIAEALRVLLGRSGYEVLLAGSGPAGWQALMRERPDALLLDLSLPGLHGAELLRRLRGAGDSIPVLAVTADSSSRSLVSVLELGADDYIVKPYRGPELVARLRAALRRAAPDPTPPGAQTHSIVHGALALDARARQVTADGTVVELSPTEFRLLEVLVERENEISSTDDVIRRVWGAGAHMDRSILRVNVYRLRRKLDATATRWGEIRSVSGVGWGLFTPNHRVPESKRS